MIVNQIAASCHQRTRFAAVFCAAWLCLIFATAVVWAESPDETLANAGLKRFERTWVVSEETEFKQRLTELEKLEKRLLDYREKIDSHVRAAENIFDQQKKITLANKASIALLKATPAGSPKRSQLDSDLANQNKSLAKLKQQIPSVEEWAQTMPLKKQLWDFISLRTEMSQAVIDLRQKENSLVAKYANLRKQDDVLQAIRLVQPALALGPAQSHAIDLKMLTRYENLVLTNVVPIYREGNFWRVNAVLNEELLLTFSYDEKSAVSCIPQSAAETLGITLTARTPITTISLDKAKLTVRQIKLQSFRIGSAIAPATDIYVLPPEAEYFGARLGYDLVRTLEIKLVPERLQVEVAAKAQAKEAK